MRYAPLKFVVLFLTLAIAPIATAQQIAGASDAVPGGTEILVRLERSINSARVKPGTPILGTVVVAVIGAGQVIIPQRARVRGQITNVASIRNGDSESRVVLHFTVAEWKDGRAPLDAYPQREFVHRTRYSQTATYQVSKTVQDIKGENCTPSAAPPSQSGCDVTMGNEITFSTPKLKDVTFRRISNSDAIALVSQKTEIVINKGQILELRVVSH